MDADLAQPPVLLPELLAAHTSGIRARLHCQPARREHSWQQIPLLIKSFSNQSANTVTLRGARCSGGGFTPYHPVDIPWSILALPSGYQYTLAGCSSTAVPSSLSQTYVSAQASSSAPQVSVAPRPC